jgi:[NiFe] hydrogenase diaphorase moiety small subunit
MNQIVKFTIDGIECMTSKGQYLVDAAKENGIFIPTLCNYPGIKPKGSCRVCTVKVNGRLMTACTTPVTEGMDVENHSETIDSLRKQIIELFFVEGNHFCPACEKGGSCELQALAYRYKILAPRYPYAFPQRQIDADNPNVWVLNVALSRPRRNIRRLFVLGIKFPPEMVGAPSDSTI